MTTSSSTKLVTNVALRMTLDTGDERAVQARLGAAFAVDSALVPVSTLMSLRPARGGDLPAQPGSRAVAVDWSAPICSEPPTSREFATAALGVLDQR